MERKTKTTNVSEPTRTKQKKTKYPTSRHKQNRATNDFKGDKPRTKKPPDGQREREGLKRETRGSQERKRERDRERQRETERDRERDRDREIEVCVCVCVCVCFNQFLILVLGATTLINK